MFCTVFKTYEKCYRQQGIQLSNQEVSHCENHYIYTYKIWLAIYPTVMNQKNSARILVRTKGNILRNQKQIEELFLTRSRQERFEKLEFSGCPQI